MEGSERNRGRRSGAHHHGHAPRGDGWLTLLTPIFHRILGRIDRGLEHGAIEAVLPGGTARRLGGRAPGPVAIVTLHRWRSLVRLATGGSAGWYEAWADGEWSSPDPVALFELFTLNRLSLGNTGRAGGVGKWLRRRVHALHRNSRGGARRNVVYHYDLGNDFYAPWLDPGMSYSSGLFTRPGMTLCEAQQAKLDAILSRLALNGQGAILEIGCGWGSFMERAAPQSVLGITLSDQQRAHVERRLPPERSAARVVVQDYRDVTGSFDGVASIEMVEAVGQEYWDDYLGMIARVLKPGGRAAIQYIAIDDAIFDAYASNVDFIQSYVFPGGMLLSESRFRAIAEAHGLSWHDRVGFGESYAETLRQWRERFDAAVAEGRLPAAFDAEFIALWRYYLMYCEGGFRGGAIDVAQVTLVKAA